MPKRSTKSEFIAKSNIIHKNKYNYSLVDYINCSTKVKIICPEHDIFLVEPRAHTTLKSGCPACSNISRSKSLSKDSSKFIHECKIIYKDKYDYSLVEYVNNYTPVKIICPIHGIFLKQPKMFLKPQGCPKCSNLIKSEKMVKIANNRPKKFTIDNFIERGNKIHNKKYDYSLVDYKNMSTKVKIICPDHGVFEQTPLNHLHKKEGCPKCHPNVSRGEKEVFEFIKSIYSGLIKENDRTLIKPKEIDIYLPELNIGVEYNGTYWHKLHEKRIPGYHELKSKLCSDKSVNLINISEYNWIKNPEKEKALLRFYICNKY